MELNIDKGRRKSFDIECVEVTDENLAAVATWCKGKVGRLHVPVLVSSKKFLQFCGYRSGKLDTYWVCYHSEQCEKCNKVLRPRVDPNECPTLRHDEYGRNDNYL